MADDVLDMKAAGLRFRRGRDGIHIDVPNIEAPKAGPMKISIPLDETDTIRLSDWLNARPNA